MQQTVLEKSILPPTNKREEEKTPPYFIKEGTDEIFGYTRFLAERADMKPFWGTLEEFKHGLSGKPQPIGIVIGENKTGEISAERLSKIIEAFDQLNEGDFATGGPYKGMPKVNALRNLLKDDSITKDERDVAWNQAQEAKKGG